MRKNEFDCPWCGAKFGNIRELDAHARTHYLKELEDLVIAVAL